MNVRSRQRKVAKCTCRAFSCASFAFLTRSFRSLSSLSSLFLSYFLLCSCIFNACERYKHRHMHRSGFLTETHFLTSFKTFNWSVSYYQPIKANVTSLLTIYLQRPRTTCSINKTSTIFLKEQWQNCHFSLVGIQRKPNFSRIMSSLHWV